MKSSVSKRKSNSNTKKYELDNIFTITNIFYFICMIAFTYFSYRINKLDSELNKINTTLALQKEPISYDLEHSDSDRYYYSIIDGNSQNLKIPSKTTKVIVNSGVIKQMTAITFDGNKFETISTLPLTKYKDQVYVTIDVEPLKETIASENIAYDYYFLYVVAMSGEKKLDLIVTEIDLTTQECNTYVYHQNDLLKLDSPINEYDKLIFENYKKLFGKIKQNNDIAAL